MKYKYKDGENKLLIQSIKDDESLYNKDLNKSLNKELIKPVLDNNVSNYSSKEDYDMFLSNLKKHNIDSNSLTKVNDKTNNTTVRLNQVEKVSDKTGSYSVYKTKDNKQIRFKDGENPFDKSYYLPNNDYTEVNNKYVDKTTVKKSFEYKKINIPKRKVDVVSMGDGIKRTNKIEGGYKKGVKYLQGTQELNFAPDYSNLYNAQDSVYNRRTKQSSLDGSIQPIASNLLDNSKLSGGTKNGIQIGSTVANVASNVIEQNSYRKDGTQDVGGAVASNSLKYGSMGASMGAMAGPIGAAVGGAIGVVGGGIYGGIVADKNNKKIQQAKQQDDFINSKNKGAINNYKYNLQGNINTDVAQTQGFAKKGKYKLKTYQEGVNRFYLPAESIYEEIQPVNFKSYNTDINEKPKEPEEIEESLSNYDNTSVKDNLENINEKNIKSNESLEVESKKSLKELDEKVSKKLNDISKKTSSLNTSLEKPKYKPVIKKKQERVSFGTKGNSPFEGDKKNRNTHNYYKKGSYKLKTETRVSHNSPDDSKASKEMIKNYKKSDPNKYKLRTNKSVIVKTFK